MTPVTDPELLKRLEAGQGPQEVTDPALLARLEGGAPASEAKPGLASDDLADRPDPGWAGVPKEFAGHFAGDALDAGANTAKALTVGLPQTLKGFFDIAKGGLSKFGGLLPNSRVTDAVAGSVPILGPIYRGARMMPQDEASKSENEGTIDALGGYLKGYADGPTLRKRLAYHPVQSILDATAFATPLSELAMASKAPMVADAGRIAGAVSRNIDPLSLTARGAAKVGSFAVPKMGSLFTGTSDLAIRTAHDVGLEGGEKQKTFLSHLTDAADDEEIPRMGHSALNEMNTERNSKYTRDIAPIRADPRSLDYTDIEKAQASTLGTIMHKGIVKDDDAMSVWQKMRDKIKEFKDAGYNTADDIDNLKQSLGDIFASTDQDSRARLVAGGIYNAAKDTVLKQHPGYAKVMSNYEAENHAIREARQAFSLKAKGSADLALRKLQSVMRNSGQSFGHKVKMLDELAEHQPNLPAAIAGNSLSSWEPRGMWARGGALTELGLLGGATALAGPHAILMAPGLLASMPRVVGHAANKLGAFKRIAREHLGSKYWPSVYRAHNLMRHSGAFGE